MDGGRGDPETPPLEKRGAKEKNTATCGGSKSE
jgi:hypothetical protein